MRAVSVLTRRQHSFATYDPAVAIAYRIYKTLGLTLVVWDGNVTGDEAEDQVRTLREDPDWPPGPLHLLDVTSVTEPPIVANTKLVEMLAELADAHQIRFVLVANGRVG